MPKCDRLSAIDGERHHEATARVKEAALVVRSGLRGAHDDEDRPRDEARVSATKPEGSGLRISSPVMKSEDLSLPISCPLMILRGVRPTLWDSRTNDADFGMTGSAGLQPAACTGTHRGSMRSPSEVG